MLQLNHSDDALNSAKHDFVLDVLHFRLTDYSKSLQLQGVICTAVFSFNCKTKTIWNLKICCKHEISRLPFRRPKSIFSIKCHWDAEFYYSPNTWCDNFKSLLLSCNISLFLSPLTLSFPPLTYTIISICFFWVCYSDT